MIKVLFFGPVAEKIGQREMLLDFTDGMTLHGVTHDIDLRYPGALSIVSFMAVNQQQVRDAQIALNDDDEIALMAKFSGG
ncbi:MAG: MoaD/ThiS family protein [Sideroxydans sp.]|nr:MoaD/ThiS family protein [Sideroxydans sp.]